MKQTGNLEIKIKILKQLKNRQARKIQSLLESQSEREQSTDQISEISYGSSSIQESSQTQDEEICHMTKSEFRVQPKRSCLKQKPNIEKLLIKNDLGDGNSDAYSSIKKFNMKNVEDSNQTKQQQKVTFQSSADITQASTPKLSSGGLSPLSFITLTKIKCSNDSLPAIQEKYKQEQLSSFNFKGNQCRQKLSTFAKKQKFNQQDQSYQSSDLSESSYTNSNNTYNNPASRNDSMILRNDRLFKFSRSNKIYCANKGKTYWPDTNKKEDTLDNFGSDNTMPNSDDIKESSYDVSGQRATKANLTNPQALPQIKQVDFQNQKIPKIKDIMIFQQQLDNLKKLSNQLKLKKEGDPNLKCLKLNPITLKKNQSSSMMSKDNEQEIEVPSFKGKDLNFRQFDIVKKSY